MANKINPFLYFPELNASFKKAIISVLKVVHKRASVSNKLKIRQIVSDLQLGCISHQEIYVHVNYRNIDFDLEFNANTISLSDYYFDTKLDDYGPHNEESYEFGSDKNHFYKAGKIALLTKRFILAIKKSPTRKINITNRI